MSDRAKVQPPYLSHECFDNFTLHKRLYNQFILAYGTILYGRSLIKSLEHLILDKKYAVFFSKKVWTKYQQNVWYLSPTPPTHWPQLAFMTLPPTSAPQLCAGTGKYKRASRCFGVFVIIILVCNCPVYRHIALCVKGGP